jgi:alpha-1,2-mannosyltransferase
VLGSVRSGEWLSAERLRAVPRMLLAVTLLAVLIWIALADGLVDMNGKPLGTDFSNVYAAGRLTLDGTPEAAWDPARQHAAEQQVFGPDTPFYGWHYPPLFLTVAAVLTLLPYGWALFAWMALTLPAYAMAIRAILPRAETALIALASPAVFINLGHGQNGFLTAALLGGGLLLLDRRPLLAGLLIGLMAYKPQFGLRLLLWAKRSLHTSAPSLTPPPGAPLRPRGMSLLGRKS